MGNPKETIEGTSTAKSGFPLISILLAMVVIAVGTVGGALYWLTKSGRLPVAGAAVAPSPAPVKVEPKPTRLIVLEPLLVNLADQGGAGYLRVVVALRVSDPIPAKGEKPKEEEPAQKGKVVVNEEEVELRDAALTVLGRETSAKLLAPEGKDVLKRELSEAMMTRVPKLQVKDVLFTEFLVQR